MKNELEKCLAGEWYDCHNPIFLEYKDTCDYGCNNSMGSNVSVNMNCTFVDCNKITIGSNVLIASNVQIYTR